MLFDLQGAQSVDHRDRGIARYVMELARALEEAAPGRVGHYLLNPDLALPGGLEPLVATGRLRFVDEADYADGSVLHLASPFELAVPLERLLPARARRARLRLVVTLFDLIPESLPGTYLEDPGLRRRYRARRELVRQADHVVAISDHTAGEAVRLLGVDPARVTTVGLAPAAAFRPPESRDGALAAARAGVPGLAAEYVLYTGGSDPRKNVEGLLEAWALLPEAVRRRWQLVLACHLPPLQRNHLEVQAGRLGFGDRLLVTGWVPEATLVALYQAAALFVFPSLLEGFGLPVVEALACGAPAIAADRSSLPELLPPEALFDPAAPEAVAGAVERALVDEAHRRRLLELAARPQPTWRDVAEATLAVHDRVACRPARRREPAVGLVAAGTGTGAGFRMALATPLPPQPGGVADYSARLLAELRELCDVDALVDGPPHHRAEIEGAQAPDGVGVRPLAALERMEAAGRPYDAVVYSLGNSEFHTGALAMAGRRPGVVLAHDVRLTNLYRFAAWQHPEAAPGGFHATLQRLYAGRVPADLGRDGHLTEEEAERWGVLMVGPAVAASRRFLATSAFAANLARLDCRPEDRGRVEVLPFSVGAVPVADPVPAEDRPGPPVVASFGVVNATKEGRLVVEAFAAAAGRGLPAGTRLVFVGPAGDGDVAALRGRASELGVADRVELAGRVPADAYRRWLERAWVAVQLRASTNGESSGAIGDCLTAGVPVVATAIGPNRDLPPAAAVTVAAGTGPEELGAVVAGLVADRARRAALGRGARAYAAGHSYRRAAEALYAMVSGSSGPAVAAAPAGAAG